MRTKRIIIVIAAVAVLVLGAGTAWHRVSVGDANAEKSNTAGETASTASSLSHLLALLPNALQAVDIAQMNLLSAQNLPGAEGLDVNRCLAVLDEMAQRVRVETERHWYRFRQDPGQFENSEGYFRMIFMAVVLAEDFQVKYAPDKIGTAAQAGTGDGFFANVEDVFLHGLTGAKHQGTCSSLPVLQVAVGRRLGYPLKLVTTKGHLFVRWEDARERFNIEAAGQGVNRFSDDYYRHWPLEVSAEEILADGHLKSLSSAGELAVFLSIRGMCLKEARRYGDAAYSFREAARLAPDCRSYALMQSQMEGMAGRTRNNTIALTQKGEQQP